MISAVFVCFPHENVCAWACVVCMHVGLQSHMYVYAWRQLREREREGDFLCDHMHVCAYFPCQPCLYLFPNSTHSLVVGTKISVDLWQKLIIIIIIPYLHFCPVTLTPVLFSVQSQWCCGGEGWGNFMYLWNITVPQPTDNLSWLSNDVFQITFICFAIFDLLLFC